MSETVITNVNDLLAGAAAAAGVDAAPTPKRRGHAGRPLGEILLAQEAISPAKLEEALAQQQQKGGRLGELLIGLKACAEEQVLKALALQLELPYQMKLPADQISPVMLKLVPINFAKQARALPLRYEPATAEGGPGPDAVAIVAVADPLDGSAFDQLRLLLDAPVSPLLVPSQSILDTINAVYDRAFANAPHKARN